MHPESHKVRIPIQQRSLNLAVCVGVVFGLLLGSPKNCQILNDQQNGL